MPAQILGAYFKSVMGSMLDATAALLFPQYRRRIAEMRDDAWYPMDDYVRMLSDLHAKLGDATMTALGQASMQKTLPRIKAEGFDTPEKVFTDFNALQKGVVRDVDPRSFSRTVVLTQDTLVLESTARVPPPLMLGYLRGLLFGFGQIVTTESVERTGDAVRFHLKWVSGLALPAANVTAPRPPSGSATPPRPARLAPPPRR
ncbi:hypothetical protein ACLESD_13160 [Pyxidicoccus sp. 3LFB2]